MTNREWLNSLSDEKFATGIMNGWCSSRECLLEDEKRPDITNCEECLLDWLKQEREVCQYITNHEGKSVRVPKVGETVYVVEMYEDETQRIKEIKWENWCNYLCLLYYDRIFYSADDAVLRLIQNESVVMKACKEAGWSKQVDWIQGGKNQPNKPTKDDNPFN